MNQQISEKIEEILDDIGIDYTERNGQYRMQCPVHGGSGKNCSIYVTDQFEPNWKCWSYNCHSVGSSLTKFLMLTLNKNKKELEEWLNKFNIQKGVTTDKSFIRTTKIIGSKRRTQDFKIPITELDSFKEHPKFYLNRSFLPETLTKFKIKYCANRKHNFFGYIIVPVLNDDGKTIAGLVGRNPNPKCLICEGYHKKNSPCSNSGTKWKNTPGFYNNSFLYNLWNAKEYIESTGRIILVEGPADVWRMYEAGIYNVVAMFGTSLSYDQKIILESLSITKVILFLDPDEAGKRACKQLKKYLERFYTVGVISYPKQPSSCNIQELRGISWK